MADTSQDIIAQLRKAIDSWKGELSETRALLAETAPPGIIVREPLFQVTESESAAPVGESDSVVKPDPVFTLLPSPEDPVARARERMIELQSLVGVLRDELSGLRQSVHARRDAQEQLQFERDETLTALDGLRKRYRKLEARSAGADRESLYTQRELEFAREQLFDLNAQVQAARETAARLAEQYEETARALGRSRLTQERMAEQIEERTAAVRSLRVENERLKSRSASPAPETIERIREALTTAVSTSDSAHGAVAELAQLAGRAGESIERAEQGRAQWAELVREMSVLLEAASGARQAAELESRAAIEALERERESFVERTRALENEIARLETEAHDARGEAERFALANQGMTEELDRLSISSDSAPEGRAAHAELDELRRALAEVLGRETLFEPAAEALESYRNERESVERALRAELARFRQASGEIEESAEALPGLSAISPDIARLSPDGLRQSPVEAARELLARAGEHMARVVADPVPVVQVEDEEDGASEDIEAVAVDEDAGTPEALRESQQVIAGLQQQLKHHERAEQAYRAEVETLKLALDRTSSLLADARTELENTNAGETAPHPMPLQTPIDDAFDAMELYQPNRALQEEIERTLGRRARRQMLAWGLMLVLTGITAGLVTLFAVAGTGNNPSAIITGAGGRIPFIGIHQMLLVLSAGMVIGGGMIAGIASRNR